MTYRPICFLFRVHQTFLLVDWVTYYLLDKRLDLDDRTEKDLKLREGLETGSLLGP